jgi:hypothetical protein
MSDLLSIFTFVKDNGVLSAVAVLIVILAFGVLWYYTKQFIKKFDDRLCDIMEIRGVFTSIDGNTLLKLSDLIERINRVELHVVAIESRLELISSDEYTSRLKTIMECVKDVAEIEPQTIYRLEEAVSKVEEIKQLLAPICDPTYRSKIESGITIAHDVLPLINQFTEEARTSRAETRASIENIASNITRVSDELLAVVQSLISGITGGKRANPKNPR